MLPSAGRHGLRSTLWQGTSRRLLPRAKRASIWVSLSCARRTFIAGPARAEHISVPCASSGNITLSLYNVRDHSPTTPLLLYLPPFPQPVMAPGGGAETLQKESGETDWFPPPPPPSFLLDQPFPVAAIHYRWQPPLATRDGTDTISLCWPTPLHDVLFAYDWIKTNLAPPLSASPAVAGHHYHKRRDFYVFGSYLSAGLATSLALTESHQRERLSVRGVAAYNGIYNWIAFVGKKNDIETSAVAAMRLPPLPQLFSAPSDMFDAFASPSLMFRTAGHLLPPLDFECGQSQDDESGHGKTTIETILTTRKAYLGFPPLQSTLVIPQALFLHKSPPPPPPPDAKPHKPKEPKETWARSARPKKIPEATSENNSYAMQAQELSLLMRRSIERAAARELRGTMLEDGIDTVVETDQRSTEAENRVRTFAVGDGEEQVDFELDQLGQNVVLDWLHEQMDRANER